MDNQARRLEKHVSKQGVRGNLGANPRNMIVIFNSILRRAFIKLTIKQKLDGDTYPWRTIQEEDMVSTKTPNRGTFGMQK